MQLYANPYDTSCHGFYFETAEEYAEKVAASGAEEFMIDLIEGGEVECAIAKAFGSDIGQANLGLFFEVLEEVDGYDDKAAAFIQLTENGASVAEAAEGMHDGDNLPSWALGTAEAWSAVDVVTAYLQETDDELLGDMPEHLRGYFDWEAYARDCLLDGLDVLETSFGWFLFYSR